MTTHYVKLAGHKFVAFQEGPELGTAVPLSALERKVSAGLVERETTTDVTVIDDKGKERRELKRQRTQQRVTRQTIGRPVQREWLAVEANTPEEAQAIYQKVMGGKKKALKTSAEFTVTTSSPDALVGARASGPRSADQAARDLLGGNAPIEE